MGLIRKTLAVGSLGVVSGSSKKQRVARQTMKATQSMEAMMRAEYNSRNGMLVGATYETNMRAAAVEQARVQAAITAKNAERVADAYATQERDAWIAAGHTVESAEATYSAALGWARANPTQVAHHLRPQLGPGSPS